MSNLMRQREQMLNEIQRDLDEAKRSIPRANVNKSVYQELEGFQKVKQAVEQHLRKLKERVEEERQTLLKEVEVFTSAFKGDLDSLRENIESKATSGADNEAEKDFDKILVKIQEKLDRVPSKTGGSAIEEASVPQLREEVRNLRDKLQTATYERRKIEMEINALKRVDDYGAGYRGSNELERIKRSLNDEVVDKKSLEKELQELKDRVKVVEQEVASKGTPTTLAPPAEIPLRLSSGGSSGNVGRTFIKEKSLEINYYDLKIVKRIGGGGFAEVFEGVLHGERVAVKKLISQSWDQEGRKELEKEVQVMMNSHSSYIVRLYGFNLYPPHMCMVMEFFPRGSLAYILWDKNIVLTWERRWAFARDAAFALNYLHSRNPPILHRDIKAGNYLVTSEWTLKLTDFGCSTFKGMEEKKSDDTKEEGFIGGTFAWTAPEVLSGKTYTEKADVYSFAMVLYEIASRRQPWDEYQAPDEQLRVRTWVGEGRRPAFPSDTPDDFKKLIEVGWENDPVKRAYMSHITKIIARKLLLNTSSADEQDDAPSGDGNNWVEEKGKILDQIETIKRQKDAFEKRFVDAQNETEKEKRKRADMEQRLTEIEGKLEQEKNSVKALERARDEADRRFQAEKAKSTDGVKKTEELEKKYKQEKKKGEKCVKDSEDAESAMEELTKKFEQEKKKRMDLQRELIAHGGSV